jgi:hypothetical protein
MDKTGKTLNDNFIDLIACMEFFTICSQKTHKTHTLLYNSQK